MKSHTVRTRSVVRNGPKGMVPYGGTNKPVRFSGMWKTHVGTKSPYGICIKSPVRWFVKYRTVCEDVENVRCLLEARTVLQEEVASGWVRNTIRCIWEKYPVRCLSRSRTKSQTGSPYGMPCRKPVRWCSEPVRYIPRTNNRTVLQKFGHSTLT